MIEPAQADPLVATLSAVIGGPRGRHATGAVRWAPPAAVLLVLTGVTFGLGMLQKADCVGSRWTAPIRFTHLCASDIPGAYAAHRLDHPVLSTYWSGAMARLTDWVHPSVLVFMVVNSVGLALLALAAAYALTQARQDRPWDAAAFALSPVLLLSGLLSTDLLAVAAIAGALWAYSRGRHVVTGLLIGLGAAATVYPALLVVAVGILAVRRRAWGGYAQVVLAAGIAWTGLNLPALLTRWDAWSGYWSHELHRGAGPGSLWLLIQDSTAKPIRSDVVTLCLVILLIAWLVGVAAVSAVATTEPTLAQVALLCVLGAVLFSPTYVPQNALWLLPLAVLARPRWRDQLIWQGAEVLFFGATWWNLAGLMASGEGDAAMYDVTIAIRLTVQLGLAVLVAYDLTRRTMRDQTMTVSSNVVVV